jgi:hypothetical protein
MSNIESRLAATERQLRFHRAVIAGLLVALIALVSYGATEGVPEVIRAKSIQAESLVVLYEDGSELAFVGQNPAKQAMMRLSGRATKAGHQGMAWMGMNSDGHAGITLNPSIGGIFPTTIRFESFANGYPHISLLKPSTLSVDDLVKPDPLPVRTLVSLGAASIQDELTGGGVYVYNKTGENVVQLLADEYGMGFVGAFDRQGKGRTLTPRSGWLASEVLLVLLTHER